MIESRFFCSLAQKRKFSLLLTAVFLLMSGGAMGATPTLQELVNRGNVAADKQDYATAVSLYEQAVKKAPADKTLRNNLAILYANYGVTLQEQKKYDLALQAMSKGMAFATPGTRQAQNLKEAQAGVYFSQAMDLKDEIPIPTHEDYERMRSLLKQGMALNPDQPAFKKAMGGMYLDEAYRLATREKYADALPILQEGMAADPENPAIRQSLANVYLGMAKTDLAHRKDWVQKAVETDSSPKIRDVGDRLLAQDLSVPVMNKDGSFASNPGEAGVKAPKGVSSLSVTDMVRDMENQLQITPPDSANINNRLEAVEKQIYGKSQSGPLSIRAKAAYTSLMGSYDGNTAQSNPNLTQLPVISSDKSYLDAIFKVTDGKIVRWGKFPLRIYFEEPKNLADYKPEYKDAALQGFTLWKVRTDGFVSFVEVKNPEAADVLIDWKDAYSDRFAEPDKITERFRNYTPPKPTKLMSAVRVASMVTPGVFSLAPQAAAAAMEYQQQKKLDVIRDESRIHLGLDGTRTLDEEHAKLLIQNMSAREFGYVLGLKGHSPMEGDLLHPVLRSDIVQAPSQRDLETLREVYNRPPNIILNTR